MLKSLFYNIAHVIVGKLIVDVFARLRIFDKSVLPKHLELMRYCGFCHTERCGYIANAHWRAVYGKEYAKTRRVSKHLEKVGQIVKLGHLGQTRLPLLYKLGMLLVRLALGDYILFFSPHFTSVS